MMQNRDGGGDGNEDKYGNEHEGGDGGENRSGPGTITIYFVVNMRVEGRESLGNFEIVIEVRRNMR